MTRPQEHKYTSHVAYTRALEVYCDALENQQPAGYPNEDMEWVDAVGFCVMPGTRLFLAAGAKGTHNLSTPRKSFAENKPCGVCDTGTLRADSNGYNNFLRCDKCARVPLYLNGVDVHLQSIEAAAGVKDRNSNPTPSKSFAETHPANPNARCKCEHWQACKECHPTAYEGAKP